MITDSIKFRGHRCFKECYSGFDQVRPVNVIIGRNNTGKSNLLDLAAALCDGGYKNAEWDYQYHTKLREEDLRSWFAETESGRSLGGNHWREHGSKFVNRQVTWTLNHTGNVVKIDFEPGFDTTSHHGETSTQARLEVFGRALVNPNHCLNGRTFRRLLADRDIRTEGADPTLKLEPDGTGATNIIRRFITSSNPKYPREIIQRDLLEALNKIFGSDGQFTEIQVQNHDDPVDGVRHGHWEVYFGQENKGLVSLSNSGSGLKTVILVLLHLLVLPLVDGKKRRSFVFAFEELENNLHPALLRRLLQYIEEYAATENTPTFLTTHSSVALDLFSVSSNAQIIHVTHDGKSA